MASGIYKKAIGSQLRADIDLINDAISCALVNANYAPDLINDQSLEDIPEAAIVREGLLINTSVDADNIFRADDITYTLVSSDTDVVGVVLFLEKRTFIDSKLICYLDNAPEFPITPDGTDITINWDAINGIFKWQ